MTNTVHEAFGQTDIGQRRRTNQDRFLCLRLTASGEPGHLLAVADGMGGHAGGEVASEIAITALREQLKHDDEGRAPGGIGARLVDAFAAANARILAHAEARPELEGMGTTLVAALAAGPRVCVANVGDSRAYALSDAGVRRLTRDHTWEMRQREQGDLAPGEVSTSPYAGMLTRSVGTSTEVNVDVFDVSLRDGEYLLLCSDGLYRPVPEPTIRDVVVAAPTLEAACNELVRLTNAAGAPDNVTCVIGGPAVPAGDTQPDSDG